MPIDFRARRLAFVLSLAAAALPAQQINRRSTGLSIPHRTIDFSEVTLANDTPVFDQWLPYGLLVSGSLFYGNPPSFGGSPFGTPALYNFAVQPSLCCTSMFALFFSSVLQGSAFNFVSAPTNTEFAAFLNGQLVSRFIAATDQSAGVWYGFENTQFNEIHVTLPGGNVEVGLDNLQVAVVPEPVTMTLVATGLAGLGLASLIRRRQRRSQTDR